MTWSKGLAWRTMVVVLGGFGLCACTHTMQPVHVSSDPSAAHVRINGTLAVGETPMTLSLDPDRSHDLRVEKTCFTAEPVLLQPALRKQTIVGTLYTLNNQLPPTVHVALRPTCAPLVREGR